MNKEIALIIITNKDKDLFYIQQKDDTHPIRKYREKYSFFGGSIEAGESATMAINRELSEELEYFAYSKIKDKIIDGFVINLNSKDRKLSDITLHFYFAILTNKDLTEISKRNIKEGKRGILVDRIKLSSLQFIRCLNKLVLGRVFPQSK
jgi:8-oxo-dGTP pyrophosphatase MutT (NUDIX family)